MQGRKIDIKDVPAMFLTGELCPMVELEARNQGDDWEPVKLIGCWPDQEQPFFCRRKNGADWWFYEARFPQPDLRDGDPVVVFDDPEEIYRNFSHFNDDGINCYWNGFSKWTAKKGLKRISKKDPSPITFCWSDRWRIPTPDELEDAGMDRDWFKGRRGINQQEG